MSCAMNRFTSALAGVCKQRHSTEKLNHIPTLCSRAKFPFLITFLNLAIIYVYVDSHFKYFS